MRHRLFEIKTGRQWEFKQINAVKLNLTLWKAFSNQMVGFKWCYIFLDKQFHVISTRLRLNMWIFDSKKIETTAYFQLTIELITPVFVFFCEIF